MDREIVRKVLRFRDMPGETGLKRFAVYDRLNPKSPRFDPTFPRPYKLGTKTIAFDAEEVRAWREAQIKARDVGSGKLP